MTSPYGTPVFPRVPNPTPSSLRRMPRAPVVNPYDKFTQPEFDAWINDITGALKHALGRDDIAEMPNPTLGVRVYDAAAVPDEDYEETVEDSFAEVKARRAAKGKHRAMDEGTKAQPVVIISEDEEEEEEDGHWGEGWSGQGLPEDEDELDERTGTEISDEQSDEHEEVSGEGSAEVIELLSDSDEGDQEAPASPSHTVGKALRWEEDVIGLSVPGPERLYSAATAKVPEPRLGEEAGQIGQNEEAEGFPLVKSDAFVVDLSDPWDGPRTFAEDYYSGGDIPESSVRDADPHILPSEVNDELEAEEDDFHGKFSAPAQV
ncbi:hypothetical protein CERSUDRAFT_98728 [Gelatoporia subvermispora B]|uniref:Uncharacterized protein n=1 Tax=Ceriporiopsis subvermispora (strain B) TaxID=914234 RepID=M2R4I0_CERS8|nr:hypothetical protein CERSUDRAFT_98728 [Gelatoporia subvermispora B]